MTAITRVLDGVNLVHCRSAIVAEGLHRVLRAFQRIGSGAEVGILSIGQGESLAQFDLQLSKAVALLVDDRTLPGISRSRQALQMKLRQPHDGQRVLMTVCGITGYPATGKPAR